MPIPTKSRFPSAITRDQATASAGVIRRSNKTSSEIAMMTSEQYKAYMQGRGQWQGADREALGRMQSPDAKSE